jgi:hypothetical protein
MSVCKLKIRDSSNDFHLTSYWVVLLKCDDILQFLLQTENDNGHYQNEFIAASYKKHTHTYIYFIPVGSILLCIYLYIFIPAITTIMCQ